MTTATAVLIRSTVLGGISVLVIVVNYVLLLDNRRRRRHASMVPFVGGVTGCVACLGHPALGAYFWVPLIIDPGIVLNLSGLGRVAGELWRTNRWRSGRTFRGSDKIRDVTLRLRHNGVFTAEVRVRRKAGDLGVMGMSMSGTWRSDGKHLLLMGGTRRITFLDGGSVLRFHADTHPAEIEELSLASVTLRDVSSS